MRVLPACLFLACALALTASARPTRAGDGGPDAGTGGAETTGTAGSGTGGSGSGGAPIEIQPSTTSDNFGCSAAGPLGESARSEGGSRPQTPGAAAALLLVALGMYTGRRARLLSSGALVALLSISATRARAADAPPPSSPTPSPTPPSLYTTPPDASPAGDDGGPRPRTSGRLRFGFGAVLTTDYVRAPFDVLGIGAFLELGRNEDAGVWAPLLRLTGTRAASTMQGGTAGATFTWLTLAADGCLIQATLTKGLWIRPCVRVSGGVLDGSATLAGQTLRDHAPWVTAGLLARMQWRPVGPLVFEAQGGAAYAFTHNALSLAPAGTTMDALPVLTPASFEPFGSIGVGLTF